MQHNHAQLASVGPTFSRRRFLTGTACGFGSLAFSALCAEAARNPLSPHAAHFLPRAKRVIFLFMQGGPSQMETFDYKPRLNADHGQKMPFGRDETFEQPGVETLRLFGSGWNFQQCGESGLWVSELFPEIGRQIDDICILNGMVTDSLAHAPACLQLHTGETNLVRPSLGSWTLYGLGSNNQNLPGFVTIAPPLSGDAGSPKFFGNAFLPAICQGTPVGLSKKEGSQATIRHLTDDSLSPRLQRRQLDLIQKMNRSQLARLHSDQQMEGAIETFELAFRMQAKTPQLLDLAGESKATLDLYGVGQPDTDFFGRQCLLARRMSEAGVRFIQLNSTGWDHHGQIRKQLPRNCRQVDRPIAGLLTDLRQRGLLDETLIVWSGEFGRTPYEQDLSEGKDSFETYGRGHNPYGFTTWLAGGGIRGGMTHGSTDEFGYRAVENQVHIHDLHATILHLLGLDHEKLTYRYAGRDFRLTDVYGRVVNEIIV